MQPTIIRRKRLAGFALIDPLVGVLAVAVVIVGALNFWRLAEYKCDRARIDARVSQILRESTDYLTYTAYDLLPADGAVLSQGSLYQLYDSASQSWKSFDNYTVTANVQASNQGTASEVRSITLNMTYQVDGDSSFSQLKTQTIRSDAISRRKS